MSYRVLVGLNYPADPKIAARLAAGKPVALGTWDEVRAEPGEIVEFDLPAATIRSLLEQGVIEVVEPAAPDVPEGE